MHVKLREVFDQTVAIFSADPRVIAGWISGSAHGKAEDEYSDVDPVFIIKDEYFEEFDSELLSVFESVTQEVVFWWPERGNNDTYKNYAILFKAPMLLQYDINFVKASAFVPGYMVGRTLDQILFDKTGILAEAMLKAVKPTYSPDQLLHTIGLFWIYAYVQVKYLLRNQTFKLIYSQQDMFESHLEILHALNPDATWDWWPINCHKLFSEEKQAVLLRYLQSSDHDSIVKAYIQQLKAFSSDAQAACMLWDLEYPHHAEAEIREFIDASQCQG